MINNNYLEGLLVHPGNTLKEIIEERNINIKELSLITKFPVKDITEIINGKKDISLQFAIILENVFDIPKSFWVNLQSIYNNELLKVNKQNI